MDICHVFSYNIRSAAKGILAQMFIKSNLYIYMAKSFCLTITMMPNLISVHKNTQAVKYTGYKRKKDILQVY